MNTTTAMKRNFMDTNLSFSHRQFRFVIGASLIAATLYVAPETMGMWSIVLLASIPFISMAIIGWDPLYAFAGKSSYVEGEEDIQQRSWTCPNIGSIDRAVRLSTGLGLMFILFNMSTMTSEMAITLLAVPLIATAITAWDPFYAAFKINSFASHIDVEAAEPDASARTLAACYNFPQPGQSSNQYQRAA